jgi:hypothetical protein
VAERHEPMQPPGRSPRYIDPRRLLHDPRNFDRIDS